MEKKNRKWKIEFSKEAIEKSKDLPNEVYEELVKIIRGFKEGKLDPMKKGKPMDLVSLNIKLRCPECYSKDVEWFLDKNSNEVDFHCLKCRESFWMTYKEYKAAIKKNPDKII